jgi:chromosomal replication initiation ATPase DnaA
MDEERSFVAMSASTKIEKLYEQMNESHLKSFDKKSRKILDAVLKVTGHSQSLIFSNRREKNVALARHIAMYLTIELTGKSYPKVGEMYQKDHSSVHNACRKIRNRGWGRTPLNTTLNAVLEELAA